MWPAEDAWRAPIGDFPPPWASAWGDDPYGLWADLTVNGATQRMRWIEPSGPEGFWMGSMKKERAGIEDKNARDWANRHEHEPRKETAEAGFWLADTPCTQAFWTAVVGKNPSHFKQGADAAERPVESVSWDDVMKQFIPSFAGQPDRGTEGRLYLPTEVEWEYAARAGTGTAYWWGDRADDVRANWDRQHKGTTPVKDYAPNPWGLYDVHGNVWECCSDVWHPRRDAPEARPDEDVRVVRGGSWFHRADDARAACRGRRRRRLAYQFGGFRFALRSPSGPEARGGGAGRFDTARFGPSPPADSTQQLVHADLLDDRSREQVRYEAELARTERLAAQGMESVERQRALSRSEDKQGDELQAQGNLRGAQRHYESALRIIKALAERDSENVNLQRDLSVSEHKLGGALHAQGDLLGAYQHYEAALRISEALAALDPDKLDWQRDLSVSLGRMGVVLQEQGDLLGAERLYEADLRIAQALAARDLDNAGLQHDLSVSFERLGDLLQALRDLMRAQQYYYAALRIREALAARDSQNVGWQRDLSVSFEKLGDVLFAQANLDGAQLHYEAALRISRALAERDLNNPSWQRHLSVSEIKLGELLQVKGDLVGARRCYEAGLRIRKALAVLNPDNPGWQRDLIASLIKLGAVCAAQDDKAMMRVHWAEAKQVLQAAMKRWPELPRFRDDLVWLDVKITSLNE